jgi:hypothetical protein
MSALTSVNWFGDCQGKDTYRSAAIFLGALGFWSGIPLLFPVHELGF